MNQAFILSAIAIPLLFAALGLLAFLVTLIGRGFQENLETPLEEKDRNFRQLAAAVAVALALERTVLESDPTPTSLGRELERGPGHWWFARSPKGR